MAWPGKKWGALTMGFILWASVQVGCATAGQDKIHWAKVFKGSPHPDKAAVNPGASLKPAVAATVITTIGDAEPPQDEPGHSGPLSASRSLEPGHAEESEPTTLDLRLHWPIPATGINSLYGARKDPITGRSRFHHGVDLDGEYGQVVRASAAGIVSFVGWDRGHGRKVIIDHRGGFSTSYSHLSQTLVRVGTELGTGAPIGKIGNSGRSTGPHLHFEVSRYGERLDPLDVLGTSVRLNVLSAR